MDVYETDSRLTFTTGYGFCMYILPFSRKSVLVNFVPFLCAKQETFCKRDNVNVLTICVRSCYGFDAVIIEGHERLRASNRRGRQDN